MTQHSNEDETTRQLRAGALPGFLRKLPMSANDNTDDRPWPLIPFPDGLDDIPAGHQELFHRPSTQLDEVAAQPIPPVRSSSWRAKLGWAAYAVGALIVQFGWPYFIWVVLKVGVLRVVG